MLAVRPSLLGALAENRTNNFQLLRFAAASMVVFFHCFALTNHWTDEPLWLITSDWSFGALGVQIFFVISGFLVTKSWEEHAHLLPFVMARILRIYPALILAVVFTVGLAGLSSPIPWPTFITNPITLDFAWHTASGWNVRYELPGAFAANPFPNAVNGSLWTIPLELRLYVCVAVVGALRLVTRRTLFAVAIGTAILASLVWPEWWPPFGRNDPSVHRVMLLFMLGALAWVFRDSLPISFPVALGAAVIVFWNPAGIGRGILFGPLFSYLVLTIAYHPLLQWPGFNRVGDYSYGIYVYAFPVQQTLVERNPGWMPGTLFIVAMPIVVAVAAFSWHVIEKPSLRLKRRFR